MRRAARVTSSQGMRGLALLAALLFALAFVAGGSADGDPASDVLVSRDIFTPYPPPSAGATQTLAGAVQAVRTRGDRVKVAVVAAPSDMGSVSSLFGDAATYARFLGLELALVYKGPLLVVMPSGFGLAVDGKSVPAANAILAQAPLSVGGSDGLTLAAAHLLPALEHAGLLAYRDSVAPHAFVSPVTVTAGRRVALRYEAWDDSGGARVHLQVENAHRVIARFDIPLRTVTPAATYRVVWRAPLRLAHSVATVCIRATDAAGNRSGNACANVTIT
jgi:hypothetical protein